MANKGVCCAAQAAGDLGKPIIVVLHNKDGTVKIGSDGQPEKRCGTCEVRPSCRNPQKLVFAFRFLQSLACGLAGTKSCQPTSAGIAQYNAERTAAASTGQVVYDESGTPIQIVPVVPRTVGRPYQLPPS
jgi:hypothetical protein